MGCDRRSSSIDTMMMVHGQDEQAVKARGKINATAVALMRSRRAPAGGSGGNSPTGDSIYTAPGSERNLQAGLMFTRPSVSPASSR